MDEKEDAQKPADKVPAAALPTPLPVDPPPTTHRAGGEGEDKPEKISKSDKIMLIATGFIALGTLVSAGAICFQWHEMRTGGVDTKTIADASLRNAAAAEGFATSAAGINTKLNDAVGKMNDQAAATHDLAVAAGKQADAAKALADLTAKQFAASQQLVASQGASITISNHSAIAPLVFHEGGQININIGVSLNNVGGLTATKVTVRSQPYYSQWGENIFREPQQRQRDFCGKPMPTYPGDVIDTSLTILPHTSLPYQINFGFRKPEQGELIDWPPKGTADELPKKKVVFLIVVGCIDYQSGLMSGSHQTGFIFWVQKGTGPNGNAPGPIPYGEDVPKDQVIVSPNIFGQGKSY